MMRPAVPGPADPSPGGEAVASPSWPRWEVFVRQRGALAHVASESVHAPDAETALQNARDTYLRRVEGVSIWVVRSDDVVVWEPEAGDGAAEEPRPGVGSAGLWEVFVRHRRGLSHVHAGSVPAADAAAALARARAAYLPEHGGAGIWLVPAATIVAADPEDAESLFAPFADKAYRRPTAYDIPEEVGYM